VTWSKRAGAGAGGPSGCLGLCKSGFAALKAQLRFWRPLTPVLVLEPRSCCCCEGSSLVLWRSADKSVAASRHLKFQRSVGPLSGLRLRFVVCLLLYTQEHPGVDYWQLFQKAGLSGLWEPQEERWVTWPPAAGGRTL